MSFLTVLVFLFLLSALIFVHELGHFLTAIRNGIKAEEFGFGFPPRLLGVVHDDATGKWKVLFGDRDVKSEKTVYSVNWIPFGGFVRMKGEDENGLDEPDSFASKSAWVRVKVLSAGVAMNFLFAWVIMSALFLVGIPQAITSDDVRAHAEDVSVQVLSVDSGSPAEAMGIMPGDFIDAVDDVAIETDRDLSESVAERSGRELTMVVRRGEDAYDLVGTPREHPPEGEGALGISFAEVGIVRYAWYEAPVLGARAVWNSTAMVFGALGALVGHLFAPGGGEAPDVTGPVGIVYLTKQMSELGTVYLLQFAAILSVNLAVFNILPFPGLDGGRILFVILEKLKGGPVREAIEQRAHQVGFLLLLLAMLLVTFRDFSRFDLLGKIGNLF